MARRLNSQQFGEYTLEHEPADGFSTLHAIRVKHEDRLVGAMTWRTKDVENVYVDEDHRRKGLATAMWQMGQEMTPRPKHSSDRTDAGDAWARAVGGRLPRRLM